MIDLPYTFLNACTLENPQILFRKLRDLERREAMDSLNQALLDAEVYDSEYTGEA
jgi:hypothetical protein